MKATAPSYKGLRPASGRASAAARGSSRKSNTQCEQLLRRLLWSRGLRYRVNVAELPGRPDIVFTGARIAVFCDGDFWHGRDLEERLARLAQGHNGPYWATKIRGNVERDRQVDDRLRALGWTVFRFWETDILTDPASAADRITMALAATTTTRTRA